MLRIAPSVSLSLHANFTYTMNEASLKAAFNRLARSHIEPGPSCEQASKGASEVSVGLGWWLVMQKLLSFFLSSSSSSMNSRRMKGSRE